MLRPLAPPLIAILGPDGIGLSTALEQICAAYDVRDALLGIVDDDRKLIGPLAVGALEHEIADFER